MQLVGIRSDLRHKFPSKKKVDNVVVLLITASGDGVIRIWSTDSTAELLLGALQKICRTVLLTHSSVCYCLEFFSYSLVHILT
jgi:WD40 repeat protein